MAIRTFILALTVLLVGCKPSGPATTKTNSSQFATVAERVKFLSDYVTFRRTYETLDFDIMYQNNGGGGMPGPSDWDVRLVATIPASELQAWVPAGETAVQAPDTGWLKTVPTTLDVSGASEWYVNGRRVIGLDRARRTIVYRAWSN